MAKFLLSCRRVWTRNMNDVIDASPSREEADDECLRLMNVIVWDSYRWLYRQVI